MARTDSQLAFGPMEVNRSDSEGEGAIQKVDLPADLPLEMAKMQLGATVRRTLKKTETPLKVVGDPSQVVRVCEGEIPSVLARVWANTERRREWIKAMAKESGLFDEQVTLLERKRG